MAFELRNGGKSVLDTLKNKITNMIIKKSILEYLMKL